MPERIPVGSDPFGLLHRRIDELVKEIQQLKNNAYPTIPIYDYDNLPQDSIEGQQAIIINVPDVTSGDVTSVAKSGSTPLTGDVTLSEGTNVTLTQTGNDIEIASVGGGAAKLYDYEVTGADKASIDTFVDGTTVSDFAGYSILEIWINSRTDNAGTVPDIDIIVNNDTSAIYDRQALFGTSTVPSAAEAHAETHWSITAHGSGGAASTASVARITIPNYAGTVFGKVAEANIAVSDASSTNYCQIWALGYRSTAAITRLKIAAQGSAKFKVGTRFIVFAR